jgi:hypothetical protein
MSIVFAIFLILHGMVHFLYAGQSLRKFELRPGMLWPDGSWLFSRLTSDNAARTLAGFLLVLAALGFIAGGLGLILRQDWWRPAAAGAAVLSSMIYILMWNGRFQGLDAQGGIGVLINLALLGAMLVLKWPA